MFVHSAVVHGFTGTRPSWRHLHREPGYVGIGQSLRHRRHADSEAGQQIHLQPAEVVTRQPGQDGQPGLQRPARAAAGGRTSPQQGALHGPRGEHAAERHMSKRDDNTSSVASTKCKSLLCQTHLDEGGRSCQEIRALLGLSVCSCHVVSCMSASVCEEEKNKSYLNKSQLIYM